MVKPLPGRSFAKPRRALGDPVSPAPNQIRFIAPPAPPTADPTLTMSIETVLPGLTAAARATGKLVFHSVGDTGGVKTETTQTAIAEAMEGQITAVAEADKPAFYYHLGDVVYFNGQSENYLQQFFEPYQFYPGPIFAIPGNHDGDTAVRPNDQPDDEPSLGGFMANFCSAGTVPAFKHRTPMDQPYCYWVLAAPFTRIIGLYSNVDGSLDAEGDRTQWDWLVARLREAPTDKWLLLAIHHPCFSLDSAHGGYENTLDLLDAAFASSERTPDVVLSGHVHDYQRFTRTTNGSTTPYIVAGAGGYADSERALHKLQKGLEAEALPFQTTRADVRMDKFDQTNPGFLRLTVTPANLTVDYFTVPFGTNQASAAPVDCVTIASAANKIA
jgi:predicted phosphodiesterase